MANITLRQSSGNTEPRLANVSISNTPLTNVQLDNNFNNLNNDIDSRLLKTGGEINGNLTVSGNTIINNAIVSEIHANDLDLRSVSSTLHRSPNAITAMFIYDTSKSSDGGAFTKKMSHTSLVSETLNGKWLGARASEAAARAVSGATTNDYFQLTTDGKIYKLNVTSGTTQVYRGNKSELPKLMALITESLGLFIYDLTEPNRPLWKHFPVGANEIIFATPTTITAIESTIAIGSASGMSIIDIYKDKATKVTTSTDQIYKGGLAVATAGWTV